MIVNDTIAILIGFTVIICASILLKVKKKNIFTVDGIFSIVGFGLGICITFMNIIYQNQFTKSIGPLLAITCLFYLQHRDSMQRNTTNYDINFDRNKLKVANIFYWIFIVLAILNYIQNYPYQRTSLFFIFISFSATMLCLEIIVSKYNENYLIYKSILKILLLSLILRGSAYFISPYPLGSDVWGHAEYIKNFLNYGHLAVSKYPSGTGIGQYYIQYPIMHLFAVASKLVLNISVHKSMFIVATTIVFGTAFVYIFTKQITGSINISLLSMLLINFSDSQIQWSVQPISMTIGILFYIILIYMLFTRNKYHINGEKQLIYVSLTVFLAYIIILTHTVSTFIFVVSIISIYISKFVFRLIYKRNNSEKSVVDITFCVLFATFMISYWMDPKYPFFELIFGGFSESVSSDMRFLGETAIRNVSNNWGDVLNIIGFLIYTLFGIIGSLSCLSRKNITIPKFSLIFSTAVLFTLFFGFPLMGLRNIIPYRWPAFIDVIFVPFIGMGIVNILNFLNNNHKKFSSVTVFVILFVSFFFMITSNVANMDSPVYGKEVFQPIRWMESEITMYKNINQSYNGTIVGDAKTIGRPFRTYLRRNNSISYSYRGKLEDVDNDKLIIWRKANIYEPEQFQLNQLDDNFSCIYDTGEGKAFVRKRFSVM